ncbi:MAG: class I SAM-dependent methyltransferase [Bdellovibrionales bacterium]|nr:class I SAM-dependent methyltransferase [Bdellovibrionales bacterium]
MHDEYASSAKFYDGAYSVKLDLQDLPFYRDLAHRYKGPILEIACGTGRISIPLARDGHQITGLDRSPAMLEVFKKSLTREPTEVQSRIELTTGDMRDFDLGKRFPMIIIPFRPIQHLYTVEDQIAALKTAARHLSPQGVFAFDVFFPRLDIISSGVGTENFELEWVNPENEQQVIRRFFRKDFFDKINQNFGGKFIYRTFQGEEQIGEEMWDLKMSFYTYPHLRALFELAGLEIREEYGTYDKGPMDNDANQMIFVLGHKS